MDDTPSTASRPAGLPTSPSRHRNRQWITLSFVLLVLGVVCAIALVNRLNERVDIVVAAQTIEADDIISRADLRIVSINGGEGALAIGADELESLVGKVAVTDIPARAIIHPDVLEDPAVVTTRTVVVGVELEPGEYPTLRLFPGDNVLVIGVGSGRATTTDETGPVADVITEATVTAVDTVFERDALLISIAVPERFATTIAGFAHVDQIRLAQIEPSDGAATPLPARETTDDEVPESSEPDEVEPVEPVDPADPADPAADPGEEDA